MILCKLTYLKRVKGHAGKTFVNARFVQVQFFHFFGDSLKINMEKNKNNNIIDNCTRYPPLSLRCSIKNHFEIYIYEVEIKVIVIFHEAIY